MKNESSFIMHGIIYRYGIHQSFSFFRCEFLWHFKLQGDKPKNEVHEKSARKVGRCVLFFDFSGRIFRAYKERPQTHRGSE